MDATETAPTRRMVDGKPLVVGIGGTLRAASSTERALRYCLDAAGRLGARTRIFTGGALNLPMYAPQEAKRSPQARDLVDALREADAVIVASPGYHGAISGLVKNALDYVEDMRQDSRCYLDNIPWGCISAAFGWQAAVGTLGQLRTVGHALRAWPTPMGVAINSAEKVWNDSGDLTDVAVAEQLQLLAVQLVSFAASGSDRSAGDSHRREGSQ